MRKFVVTALSLAVMMGTSVQMGYCGILDGNRYDEDTTISQIYEKNVTGYSSYRGRCKKRGYQAARAAL